MFLLQIGNKHPDTESLTFLRPACLMASFLASASWLLILDSMNVNEQSFASDHFSNPQRLYRPKLDQIRHI